MYAYIHKMIPRDVKTVKPVVEREAEVADVSALEGVVLKMTPEVSRRGRVGKISEVLYDGVFSYDRSIVKMKGGLKGVRICHQA